MHAEKHIPFVFYGGRRHTSVLLLLHTDYFQKGARNGITGYSSLSSQCFAVVGLSCWYYTVESFASWDCTISTTFPLSPEVRKSGVQAVAYIIKMYFIIEPCDKTLSKFMQSSRHRLSLNARINLINHHREVSNPVT